jgi:predicted DNA-binding protein with PD1-like motif
MQSKKVENGYLLRLIKGEKIVTTITTFCEENNIHAGVLSGLGGASDITLGYYNMTNREYQWKDFESVHEILSMNGNVALVDGKPFLHIHMSISDDSFATFGGHLKEATVGATCEVMISDLATKITRIYDDEIGLKLLEL